MQTVITEVQETPADELKAARETTGLDKPVSSLLRVNWETALYVAFFVLAVLTRFWDLGARAISHDESLHARYAWELYQGFGYAHSPLMHGMLRFLLDALSFAMFGADDFTVRIPAAFSGVLLVMAPILLRRWLGRRGALVASFLILISPMLLYHARYIRDEPFMALFAVLMVWAMLSYFHDRATKWLYALAVLVALMYVTMEAAFIYIAVFGAFVLVVAVIEIAREMGREAMVKTWLLAAAGLLILGILMLLLRSAIGASAAPPPAAEPSAATPPAAGPPLVLTLLAVAPFLAIGAVFVILLVRLRMVGLLAALAVLGVGLAIGVRIVGTFRLTPPPDGSAIPLIDILIPVAISVVFGALIGGGAFYVLRRWMPDAARRSPALGLVVILGGLSLFMLSTSALSVLNYGAVYQRVGDNYQAIPDAGTTTVYGVISGTRTEVFVDGYFFASGNFPSDPANMINVVRLVFLFACFAGLAMGLGLWWNSKVWPIAVGLFGGIGVTFFTTVFTNGTGLGTGFVGSLGYWLAQQAVNRGTQPEGYHFFIGLMYEYLPMLLTIVALVYFGFRYVMGRSNTLKVENPDSSDRLSVPLLMTFAVLLWAGFTAAGEKMPWHQTHLAVPMVLIGGRLLGEWLDQIDWRGVLARREWLAAILVPILVLALIAAVSSLDAMLRAARSGAAAPSLDQLNAAGGLLSGLLVGGGALAGLYLLLRRSGLRPVLHMAGLSGVAVLSLLTMHTAWIFSYVEYDYPTEFGVFAHGGPGLKVALSEIEQLSQKLTGTPNEIEVGYDSEATWPWQWYLRDFPNKRYIGGAPTRADANLPVMILSENNWAAVDQSVGSNYYWFQFHRIWWPTYDYNRIPEIMQCPEVLTQPDGTVVRYAAYDENGDGAIDAQERDNGDARCNQRTRDLLSAFWDIWFFRDYALYARLTGQRMTRQNWPYQSDFRLYIRKDLAAKVWDQAISSATATSEGSVPVPLASDPYQSRWRDVPVIRAIGSAGSGNGQLQSPHGMAIAPDGSVYVADSNNHRVVKFDQDGNFVLSFGNWSGEPPNNNPLNPDWNPPPGTFYEPWDVAVGPDGSVYVADLWNSRVQKFDADGKFIALWGGYGDSNQQASGAEGKFFGPRGIAVSSDGRVYVADTGNKRVQVFDSDGQFLTQFGGGGLLDGNLDEPVGVAVNSAGEVAVADTWNGRIQVFSRDGQALRKWNIEGWLDLSAPDLGQSRVGKPYLGIGPDDRIYVADQVGSRILVFDPQGQYLAAFGKLGADLSGFSAPSGIAIDPEGNILVVDTGNGRVVVFPPATETP